MQTFPAAKSWRTALFVALALFLVTRALTLRAFPIFNDEALYLQYSQAIHDDWQKNRFISMNGDYNDWKPPLQYWLAAPVIRWGSDPLMAGRAVAAAVSLLGLLGTYLLARELFGPREGVLAAWLFVLCPAVVFHNLQFTAETFLFSVAPVFYWALLKAMRRAHWWLWIAVAVLAASALLLLKQSGFLLLLLAVVFPLVRFARSGESDAGGWSLARCDRKSLALDLGLLAGVIFVASLAASLVLPVEFDQTREHFDSRWVMSPGELLQLPIKVWTVNLRIVGEYVGAYYSWSAAIFFGACVWLAVRRRNFGELGLLLMCATGGGAVIFLLRAFNEYMFNTAVIAALLPLIASAGLAMWGRSPRGTARSWRAFLLLTVALTAVSWSYQIVLMARAPGRYIQRSTPWAIENYLASWSTGFGIKEVVAMLEKEPGPGVIFADPQWGNPRTALEVYGRQRFPTLRLITITSEFLNPQTTRQIAGLARKIGSAHFLIFSAGAASARRETWVRGAEQDMCESRTEVKASPGQMPIIVCRF